MRTNSQMFKEDEILVDIKVKLQRSYQHYFEFHRQESLKFIQDFGKDNRRAVRIL